MKIVVGVNPRFKRGGIDATKVVFITNRDFAFGIYINRQTGRSECQKYLGAFNYGNMNAGCKAVFGLKAIADTWQFWTDEERKSVCSAVARTRTSYYKHMYYRADFTIDEKKFALQSLEILHTMVQELYKGNPANIPAGCEFYFDNARQEQQTPENQVENTEKQWVAVNSESYEIEYLQKIIKVYHDAGALLNKPFEFDGKTYRFNNQRKMEVLLSASEKQEGKVASAVENQSVRKMITLFKMIHAENFKSLFEGNFYPIINESGNYITIKDGEQIYKVRKDRGMKIEVYDEPETAGA